MLPDFCHSFIKISSPLIRVKFVILNIIIKVKVTYFILLPPPKNRFKKMHVVAVLASHCVSLDYFFVLFMVKVYILVEGRVLVNKKYPFI